MMRNIEYTSSGRDRPLDDREGSRRNWTPEQVERTSNEEVKNPEGNDVDEEADIDDRDEAAAE